MSAGTFAGFRTRAQVGLEPPRSRSFNVDASRGGLAKHWIGGPLRIDPGPGGHAACEAAWRNVQRQHFAKGWVDLAYSFAFCQHGHVLAGRGLGVRTAAQGTNDGNDRYYAAVWLGGEGETPTPDALAAYAEVVRIVRAAGAGDDEEPHSRFRPTACPGNVLREHRAGDVPAPRPPSSPTPPKPAPPAPSSKEFTVPAFPSQKHGSRGEYVGRLQGLLLAWGYRTFTGSTPDKHWGDRTEAAMLAFCKERGIVSRSYRGRIVAGPNVAARLVTG